MICKQCKIEFHYCTSCDYDTYCSEGYCTSSCYETSDEYKNNVELLNNFYNSLNDTQKQQIKKLYDDVFDNDKYYSILEKIMK